MHRFISSLRYLALIAVAALLAAAITLLCYGTLSVAGQIAGVIASGSVSAKGAKSLTLGFIESADLFLVAIALKIMALGLYELFIDSTIPLPAWLRINSLDDLKNKLIGVIVVVLAVVFLGNVVAWHGEEGILYLGIGIGAVVASLTLFAGQKKTQK